jgi:nucleoside-diphosphate-sugar epimerase
MSDLHVVFGSGAIGRAIANELIRRKKQVRVVNRTGKMLNPPAGIELVAADLYHPGEVRSVTKDAVVAYQCAQPAYTEWPQKFPPLQASIIEGLSVGSAKLVLVENMYMYGETNGKVLNEGLPYDAHTRKGRIRAELSCAALEAHQQGKLRVTIGRASDYFGPWGTSSAMGDRVFPPLLKGKSAQVGGRLDVPHTYTYVPDFGKALVILGEKGEADGQAWHVPNDMPSITQGEFIRLFCEEAGVEPKISTMGKFMMSIGGLFIPEARESVEMMYEFEKPFIVDSSKFEKIFGMKATPLPVALKETAAWYKQNLN